VLVGRTAEQRRVGQVLDTARAGRAAVLAVVGEAGQGKSSLLEDACSRAHGMTVLRARGVASETHVPFAGLFELLRPVLGRLDRLPGPQALALEGALALRPARPQDRFAVGAATLGLLAAAAEDAPLLVLVDDVHALDEASGSALLFALRRLLADAVAVLLAARPEPSLLDGADLPVLPLRGLDLPAAADVVRQHARQAVQDATVERLHRETAGNPLALMELAAEPRALHPDGPPDTPLAVVPTVAAVYQRRCRSLPEPAARLLLLAAVGEGSDLLVLSAAARFLELDLADLAPAETAGLVQVGSERIVFRHPLVRAAVYGDAAPPDRRAVHRALSRALPDVEADRRAWHLALAALGPDEGACAALEQAGDRARLRSAYDAASRAYQRAARLCVGEPRRSRLVRDAADAAWSSGDVVRAAALLDELTGQPLPPDLRATVERLRGRIAARCGPVSTARRILVAGAEELAGHDADGAVVMLAEALNPVFYAGDPDAMLVIADRIDELARAEATERTVFIATLARGMSLLFGDDGEGGAALVREALEVVRQSRDLADDPQLLVWHMMGPLWLREAGSDAVLDTALEITRERLAVGTLPFLLTNLALCRAAGNRWPEAEAGFSEAIVLARHTGQQTDLAAALARLAWLEARQGKESACREHAGEALVLSQELELVPCELWVYAALTDLELALGHPERALEHAENQQRLLTRSGVRDVDLFPGPEIVEACLRLRQVGRAAEQAERFAAAALKKGQPWAGARAARCCGLVAGDAAADALFEQALELHAQTPDVFETARTRLAYGSRLRRGGQRVRSREQLREAIATFDRLGAEPWSALARDELAATGETARSRQLSSTNELTPQELHLALLLAGGRTTREAAAAVFLSPKTVEYHLRSVYRKLGINSRQQLAETLAARGDEIAAQPS
jgi:DNA-binding CsgD family transcriptional regulator